MSRIRKKFSADFKAKVALEALSSNATLAELSAKYGVHANQISKWKAQMREGATGIFNGQVQTTEQAYEAQIKALHSKIGQLTMENDFLQTLPNVQPPSSVPETSAPATGVKNL